MKRANKLLPDVKSGEEESDLKSIYARYIPQVKFLVTPGVIDEVLEDDAFQEFIESNAAGTTTSGPIFLRTGRGRKL